MARQRGRPEINNQINFWPRGPEGNETAEWNELYGSDRKLGREEKCEHQQESFGLIFA